MCKDLTFINPQRACVRGL